MFTYLRKVLWNFKSRPHCMVGNFNRQRQNKHLKAVGEIRPVKSFYQNPLLGYKHLVDALWARFGTGRHTILIIPFVYGLATHPGGSWLASRAAAGRATGHRLGGEASDGKRSSIHDWAMPNPLIVGLHPLLKITSAKHLETPSFI